KGSAAGGTGSAGGVVDDGSGSGSASPEQAATKTARKNSNIVLGAMLLRRRGQGFGSRPAGKDSARRTYRVMAPHFPERVTASPGLHPGRCAVNIRTPLGRSQPGRRCTPKNVQYRRPTRFPWFSPLSTAFHRVYPQEVSRSF